MCVWSVDVVWSVGDVMWVVCLEGQASTALRMSCVWCGCCEGTACCPQHLECALCL